MWNVFLGPLAGGSSSENEEVQGSNCFSGIGVLKWYSSAVDGGMSNVVYRPRMQKRPCSRGLDVYSTVPERVGKKPATEIWNAHFIVRRAMCKYYMCVRRLKASACIDLNSLPYDDDSEDDILPRKVRPPLSEPKNPWQLGWVEVRLFQCPIPSLLKDIALGDDAFDSKM
jgi:hypothetical protein